MDHHDEKDFIDQREVSRLDVFQTFGQIHAGVHITDEYDIQGIVLNLSSRGCCMLLRSEVLPEAYEFCRVSIGKQTNLIAQVRWVQEVEPGLFKVGFHYQM